MGWCMGNVREGTNLLFLYYFSFRFYLAATATRCMYFKQRVVRDKCKIFETAIFHIHENIQF